MKMIKAVLLSFLMTVVIQLSTGLAYAGEVSINNADASTLAAELTGIGKKKAEAIVEYRKLNGKFLSINDLQKVKGISVKTIDKNKENLTL